MAASGAETWPIGGQAVISVADDGEKLNGEILAYDVQHRVLVLQQPSPRLHQRHTLHFLQASSITKVHSVTPPSRPPARLLPLDLAPLKDRAAKELQAAELRAARIGVGVSAEGQQVFDALAKTMDCRWSGATIVCMDEVTVREPYGEADVAPIGKEHHATCDRIRQIVREERSRWS